nr:WRKY17 [Persea americana]
MYNQSLLEDQEGMVTSNVGFHTNNFSCGWTHPQLAFQQLKSLNNPSSMGEDLACHLNGSQLGTSSIQRTSAILWPWGEMGEGLGSKRQIGDNNLAIAAMKMKKVKARRKVREPRFCFKTMSDVDVLDDGYKWRKYGQKVVKNTQHPSIVVHSISVLVWIMKKSMIIVLFLLISRSYYRCTQDNCRVKKRVERLAEDPRMVITTYEGRHIHSPWHDVDDSNASSQLDFIW